MRMTILSVIYFIASSSIVALGEGVSSPSNNHTADVTTFNFKPEIEQLVVDINGKNLTRGPLSIRQADFPL